MFNNHSAIDRSLHDIILSIPIGYSEVRYHTKTYSLTRSDFNNGKSFKVFAQELGGKDFISFNYYMMTASVTLKPCEMPMDKVVDFLKDHKTIS
ncbi:MAG: peptide methionine sulfoxide reductase [Bacteroidota bacterium]